MTELRWRPAKTSRVLVGIATGASLLIAGISYLNARHLILQAQERTRAALAEGLVVAISDQLITHDYAGIESRIIQTMADESIESALVTDDSGRVLVHLHRDRPGTEPELLFQPTVLHAPTAQPSVLPTSQGVSTRWSPINSGTTDGWLRLRMWSSSTDAVLDLLGLQYLVLGVLTAALLSTALLTSYRQIRQRVQIRESELQREKELLEQRAFTDPLTGALNRDGMEKVLRDSLEQLEAECKTSIAFCMIDLDNFKPINDYYGNALGDLLLQAVCKRLQRQLRDRDILCRVNGDAFLVAMKDCQDINPAISLANRVTNSLDEEFFIEEQIISISASVGIALGEAGQGSEFDDLIELAEQAMYDAKRAGEGRVVLAQQRESA